MCNKNNPAGDVTSRDPFQRFTLLCILLGVAITMKRYWMSYHLARRLYYRYGGSVRSLADKLTLFAESSSLALVRRQQCDATMLISPAPSRDNDNEPEDAFDILPHLLRPVHHESFRSSPMETKNVSLKNCLKGMGQSEALDGFSYLDEWDEPSDVKKSECVSSKQKVCWRRKFFVTNHSTVDAGKCIIARHS